MTLTKAIEAAKRCQGYMENAAKTFGEHSLAGEISSELDKALAALPDKPMTEEEIAKIIQRIVKMNFGSGITASKIIQELKAANVLYVEEK